MENLADLLTKLQIDPAKITKAREISTFSDSLLMLADDLEFDLKRFAQEIGIFLILIEENMENKAANSSGEERKTYLKNAEEKKKSLNELKELIAWLRKESQSF